MDLKKILELKNIRNLSFWHYQIIGWIVVKIVIDSQIILGSIEAGKSPSGSSLLVSFVTDLFGFFLTLGMRYIYRYIYKKQLFVSRAIMIVAGVSYIASALAYMFYFPLERIIWLTPSPKLGSVLTSIMSNFPIFFVWSLLYFGIRYWKDISIEKEKTQDAVLLAQKAKLQMLRYQLNPHFLFNSLNSIQALVHENPDMAEVMVTELSDFLRSTLQFNGRLMIPVSEEVEITRKYLAIEKIRFEERLSFTFDIDEHAMDIEIPCFITQPLVENSIIHGLQNNPEGINIILKFFINEDQMIINIANTGHLSADWQAGIAIRNIIERFENAYGESFRFKLTELDGFVIANIIFKIKNESVDSTYN